MNFHRLTPVTRFLKPGEIACMNRPTVVTTILGSCVAIVLSHPQRCLGAICHAVFPASPGEPDLKYVDKALHHMLKYFDRRAIKREAIVTKLFGGANMFSKGGQSVGNQNVDAALWGIEQAGLRLAASDVGGPHGRKLLFISHTGEIFLKKFNAKDPFP